MFKLAGLVTFIGVLLLQQNGVDATTSQRKWRRDLQKGSKGSLKNNKYGDIPKHCLYIENEVLWTELFTDVSVLFYEYIF